MRSCLYRGTVSHRREHPVPHAFAYPICMAYLDLDELPSVFSGSWLWGVERPAPVGFRRRDHLGGPDVPLAEAVRTLVEKHAGQRPQGPIRLLTQPRSFGFHFNPASFHYCFGRDGTTLEHLVVDVTNTPWLERHAYVLDLRESHAALCPKTFHVSPFMAMGYEYAWHAAPPGEELRLSVRNLASGRCHFSAALALQRVAINPRSLRAAFARAPFQSLRLTAGIYAQALRLWLKGAPFHPHPGRAAPAAGGMSR